LERICAVSADLLVSVADEKLSGFSVDACGQFVARYGFGLVFSEGFDVDTQIGFLPCLLTGVNDGEDVETGFEVYDLSEDAEAGMHQFSWGVSAGGDGFDWMLAHAVGAYFVAELEATLEDPQEDNSWGQGDLAALDGVVVGLLDEAIDQ
jgi:hypothetical protein